MLRKKLNKRIISILALICMLLTMIAIPVQAKAAETHNIDILISGNEPNNHDYITIDELEQLKDIQTKTIETKDVQLNAVAIYEIQTIYNYGGFRWRYSQEFNQYYQGNTNTNCVPTAMTNIIEYWNKARGLNMYSGELTQAMYDQICTDVSWKSSGSDAGVWWSKQEPGFRAFASRYGRNVTVNNYWLNLWSDVTRDVKASKPIMASINGHMYVVVGYKIENGTNYLICLTNYPNLMEYIIFPSNIKMQSVVFY